MSPDYLDKKILDLQWSIDYHTGKLEAAQKELEFAEQMKAAADDFFGKVAN